MKNKIKEYKVIQPLLLGLAMAIGIFLGVKLNDKQNENVWIKKVKNQITPIGKVEELLRFIDAKYVDSLDQEKIIRRATASVISQLDPYSEYMIHGEGVSLNESLDGYKEGFGIKEIIYKNKVYVYDVLAQSSAASVGIQKGDHIISINDILLDSEKRINAQNNWFEKAAIGEVCDLTIARGFDNEILHFKPSISYNRFEEPKMGYRINEQIAYIKINQFSKDTYKRFMSQFETMYEQKEFDYLIIDIRGNSGGYLQEAINIVNQFFDEKDKLLLTTNNKSKVETTYKSTGRSFFPIKKLAVLVDNTSASASEILAGIIQDYDLGFIIGQATFGKGMIQEQFSMMNGDMVRLSVARYKLPTGRRVYNDLSDFGDVDSVKYYSKVEKQVLYSGKILPDIVIDENLIRYNEYYHTMNSLLEPMLFSKLYSDKDFSNRYFPKDTSLSDLRKLNETEMISFLNSNMEVDSLTELEKNAIFRLSSSILLTHTEGFIASQKFLNESDECINKAIDMFDKISKD